MNREWMRARLTVYKDLLETWDREDKAARHGGAPKTGDITSQINIAIPTVRKIVSLLDPDLVKEITPPMAMYGVSSARKAVEQALGILRDQEEWEVNLGPDSPSLIANQFHPSVWTAASAIWDTGQYRVAVQQGAVSLSAHIAAKVSSSLTERELVQLVFSPAAPSPGQTRLHYSGDKSSKIWKSRQEGLHLLAQGAFAGIRNVATHTGDEWTEQVALEHLAVLSVVARWADETQVVQ
jgi:hypothetical protein